MEFLKGGGNGDWKEYRFTNRKYIQGVVDVVSDMTRYPTRYGFSWLVFALFMYVAHFFEMMI